MADQEDERSLDQLEAWHKRYEAGDESARDLFTQISHIALLLSYDLIDKMRYWEKETLKLPDDEIEKRLAHMSDVLEKLKTAYVTFAEVDF